MFIITTQAAEFYRNPTAVTRRRRVLILTRIALIDDHNGFQVSGTKIRYLLRNLIRRNCIPCNKHIITSRRNVIIKILQGGTGVVINVISGSLPGVSA